MFPQLPCFPCPHGSACCAWGTTLTPSEADSLRARHGEHVAYQTRWGEWRTRVRNKRCVFFDGAGCSIHADPSFPKVCGAFPWTDAETGGPYPYDRTICPEFVSRPELLHVEIPERPDRKTG